ncbi:MAG TPA: PAS domain-containing protein [Actinomycetota bacterium]|nr:PAS domain-containing protein [Actinomycetota bacterium]
MIGGVIVALFGVATALGALEGLSDWLVSREQSGGAFMFVAFVAVGAAVFSVLRWRQATTETSRRIELEKRYRLLVERSPAVIYEWRPGRGPNPATNVFVGAQIEELLGYSDREWIEGPGPWPEVIHPDDRDEVLAGVAETATTGVPFHMEYRAFRRDGRLVWIHDEGHPVSRDADGRPTLVQGVMVDVTRTKEAEEQVRAAEERFRAIVEHIPAAVYLDRPDGSMETVYISPQVEEIMGVPVERYLHEPDLWLQLMDDEDRVRCEQSYLDAVQNRRSWRDEYRIRTPDGRPVWIHDETTFLVGGDGRPLFLLGVLADVTERKRAEEALRESERREHDAAQRLRALDDMKNTFLAAVSHELRSPLTSILGLSLTLERSVDLAPEDRQDLVGRLSANAQKLDRLLKDLLDIDRLHRGIVEPQLRSCDVGALARGVLAEMDLPSDRRVVVEAEPTEAHADAAKVERIVENLVTNAVRHTSADGTVWVRVEPHAGGVLLRVEDDGPGVAPEHRRAIFEPFRQGPNRRGSVSSGTGIGLSLVQRFAALHGGRAWVEERPGGGASFRVFLPGSGASDELDAELTALASLESRGPG